MLVRRRRVPAAGAVLPNRTHFAPLLAAAAACAAGPEAVGRDLTAPWTPAPVIAVSRAAGPAAPAGPLWNPAAPDPAAAPLAAAPNRLPLFGEVTASAAPTIAPLIGATPAGYAPPAPGLPLGPAVRPFAPPPPVAAAPAPVYGPPLSGELVGSPPIGAFPPAFVAPGPPVGVGGVGVPAPGFPPPDFIAPPPATLGTDPLRSYGRPAVLGVTQPPPVAAWGRAAELVPSVRLDTPTSAALLDFQNRQTDKQLILLGSLPNVLPDGEFLHPVVVPAAQMRLSGLYGRTNTKDKFGYLGRFPPDFNSRTATDLRILQANLAATAYFTPWAAGYVETLFSDVFTFPTFEQGSFQVRQAYAVFGDARRSPFYAFIGKKNVSYGDFGTLSPFSQALPWHYFAALGEGAGVGYVNGGFHAVLTGLAGGRGIRVSDSPDDGHVNNFAVNTHYAGVAGPFEYLVGAGYLHGTIYDADVPEHIRNDLFGPLNGAGDLNGTLRAGRWTFAGEYVKTLADWPVTNFPVSAWKAEGAYDLSLLGAPLRLSVSWSEGKQAPSGLEFDRNDQLVIGAGWQPNPNALLSVEYVRSIGFAPLIALTAPGVSERDARQNSLVLGVSLVL